MTSLIKRMQAARVDRYVPTGKTRSSLCVKTWTVAGGETRWCIAGTVALRCGITVEVWAGTGDVMLWCLWRGRTHRLSLKPGTTSQSRESLRRLAVAFAERVMREGEGK